MKRVLFGSLILSILLLAGCNGGGSTAAAPADPSKPSVYGTVQTTSYRLTYLKLIDADDDLNTAVLFFHGSPPENSPWVKKIIAEGTNTFKMLSAIHGRYNVPVFAIARPGFNGSSGRNTQENTYSKKTVAELKEAIEFLKNTYGIGKFRIFGFSAGATVSAELALVYPELFNNAVLFDGSYDTNKWLKLRGKSKLGSFDLNSVATAKEMQSNPLSFTLFCSSLTKEYYPVIAKDFYDALNGKVASVNMATVEGDHYVFFDNEQALNQILAELMK